MRMQQPTIHSVPEQQLRSIRDGCQFGLIQELAAEQLVTVPALLREATLKK